MEIHDLLVLWIFCVMLRVSDDHNTCTCKNENGEPVDWFIVYKVPAVSSRMNPNFTTTGKEILYMDYASSQFLYRNIDITTSDRNPLYKTLQPIYDGSSAVKEFAMYNDQLPDNANASKRNAHSKGALAFGSSKGFWMISSVPKFPAMASTRYAYLDSQTVYGQTILCVTLKASEKSIIKSVFKTTNPTIYDGKAFIEDAGNSPTTYKQSFRTDGNVPLKVFAKSANFGKDIYRYLISPGINNTKLWVQTWRPNLENTTRVKNIEHIFFRRKQLSFKTTVDHSKWAVAFDLPWTCIGDLNRNISQFKRGGHSLCLENRKLARAFRRLFKNHRSVLS